MKTIQCSHCNGRGELAILVSWSDGVGQSARGCPACDGHGMLDMDTVVSQLAEAKELLLELSESAHRSAGYNFRPEFNGKSEDTRQVINNETLRIILKTAAKFPSLSIPEPKLHRDYQNSHTITPDNMVCRKIS